MPDWGMSGVPVALFVILADAGVERVVEEGSSVSESPSISCTIDGGIDGLGWSTDGLSKRE